MARPINALSAPTGWQWGWNRPAPRPVPPGPFSSAPRKTCSTTQPAESQPGGRTFVITDAVVQLPIGPERFVDNDRVTVTVAVFDPDLVGVALSVTSREVKSQATMRRLHVSEVSS